MLIIFKIILSIFTLQKNVYIAIKKQNIFYNQKNIIKKFIYLDIIFINIFNIFILVNNFYNISYLNCYN